MHGNPSNKKPTEQKTLTLMIRRRGHHTVTWQKKEEQVEVELQRKRDSVCGPWRKLSDFSLIFGADRTVGTEKGKDD